MVIKTLCLEEENIIKDIRNLLRLGKETEEFKDRIVRDNKVFLKNWE